MEGDVMDKVDKVEATATVRDFDPISGSIPATKVEITVSCRWGLVGFLLLLQGDSFFGDWGEAVRAFGCDLR